MGARLVLTCLAYFVALGLTGWLAFIGVLWLAGPHGGVLPQSMHTTTLVVGWVLVLVVPILIARCTWRGLVSYRRAGGDLSQR